MRASEPDQESCSVIDVEFYSLMLKKGLRLKDPAQDLKKVKKILDV